MDDPRTGADGGDPIVWRFSKTVSEADVYLFAGVTGDFDRAHTDEEWCRSVGLGSRIAHGALILGFMSTASTQALATQDRLVLSVGYDRLRFLRPVRFGDTITVTFTLPAPSVPARRERLTADVKAVNQDDEVVAVADHHVEVF